MCDNGSSRRQNLLMELKCMMDQMDTKPQVCCCEPMIELYDPCPKPAIPLACPAPVAPLDPEVPVPHVASPANPCGGVCIPIVTPQPVPCIPLAKPCPTDQQPCVPCNPPQMMVCYRRPFCRPGRGRPRGMLAGYGLRGAGGQGCAPGCGYPSHGGGCGMPSGCGMPLQCCRSRELRASILYQGCDCERRNGLQDQCPRFLCQGRQCCLTDPPSCCPSQYAGGKHLVPYDYGSSGGYGGGSSSYGGGCGSDGCFRAEYLCYPAYFKMPPCSPNSCPPCGPNGPLPCSPYAQPSCGPCPPCTECCPLPQCCPPVPTIPLPPCPPVTVPAPPVVIPSPVPLPVPTPVYPSCPTVPPCVPCC